MFGSKLLLGSSLLLLTPVPAGGLATDIKTQSSTHSLWYNGPFQCTERSGQHVMFPGDKADFFR